MELSLKGNLSKHAWLAFNFPGWQVYLLLHRVSTSLKPHSPDKIGAEIPTVSINDSLTSLMH